MAFIKEKKKKGCKDSFLFLLLRAPCINKFVREMQNREKMETEMLVVAVAELDVRVEVVGEGGNDDEDGGSDFDRSRRHGDAEIHRKKKEKKHQKSPRHLLCGSAPGVLLNLGTLPQGPHTTGGASFPCAKL